MYDAAEYGGRIKKFLQHKKKQSCLPWNKVKALKSFAIWSFSSSGSSRSSSSSSSRSSSSSSKRRKRYTKYTEEKEAEDENWQKKMRKFFTSFWFLTQFNSYISIYTL